MGGWATHIDRVQRQQQFIDWHSCSTHSGSWYWLEPVKGMNVNHNVHLTSLCHCVCCLKKLWEEQKGSGWMGHGWSHVNHNGRPLNIPQEPFHWIVFGRKLCKNLGFVHGRISRSPLSDSEFREWIKIILPCLIFIVNNSKTSHN